MALFGEHYGDHYKTAVGYDAKDKYAESKGVIGRTARVTLRSFDNDAG